MKIKSKELNELIFSSLTPFFAEQGFKFKRSGNCYHSFLDKENDVEGKITIYTTSYTNAHRLLVQIFIYVKSLDKIVKHAIGDNFSYYVFGNEYFYFDAPSGYMKKPAIIDDDIYIVDSRGASLAIEEIMDVYKFTAKPFFMSFNSKSKIAKYLIDTKTNGSFITGQNRELNTLILAKMTKYPELEQLFSFFENQIQNADHDTAKIKLEEIQKFKTFSENEFWRIVNK